MPGITNSTVKRLNSVAIYFLLGVSALLMVSPQSHSATNGRIAFASDRDGSLEIYSMNSDGSDQTRLTNNQTNFDLPDWSPDGKKIAFSSLHDGVAFEIYVMNADGSGMRKLSNNTPDFVSDGAPSWSPDGLKIAFGAERKSFDAEYNDEIKVDDIYVMNADGSGQRNLTNNPNTLDRDPSWSPDGSKIIFSSIRFDESENEDIDVGGIYIMNADGSDQRKLVSGFFIFGRPDWSPDGTKVAFGAFEFIPGQEDSMAVDIFSTNADGSGRRNLTDNIAPDLFPSWSPNGNLITFTSMRDGNGEIYVMNSNGSGQKNISRAPGSDEASSSWQSVPSDKGGSGNPTDKRFFVLDSPKLKRSKTKRIKRKMLYRYLRRGFKGRMAGYKRLRGSLVRVVKRRSKGGRSKHRAVSRKRCYKVIRKRTSCKRTHRRGIRLKNRGSSTRFTYKPLAASKRSFRRLKRGKGIRRGLYNLTFKAKPKSGGKYKTFRYRLRVR